MHWHSHDNDYGIGKEIESWLVDGCHVVVSGSRGYLPEASARYPDMQVIQIQVDPLTLRERLRARGRESKEDINRRMQRSAQLAPVEHPNLRY